MILFLRENFRNSSGTKTEKLKNWIFQRDPGRDSPYGFNFSVLLTELFRNISGDKTEKLKSWETVFFMENLSLDLSGKNSFSVFQFCLRNSSGTFPETKLKTWKTVFLWRISPWISLEKTVFQFCLRNSSGTFPETKLKNWKTVFLWRISPWMSLEKTVFQFFSFAYGSIPEHTTFFSRAVYVIYFYMS